MALALVRFMEDHIVRCVVGGAYFLIALFISRYRLVVPTLVCFIAGYSAVSSSCALWFLTSPCGCWLCSTSLPGGNQVDGLPPAPSWAGNLGGMFCAQTLIARDHVITFERRSKVTRTYV